MCNYVFVLNTQISVRFSVCLYVFMVNVRILAHHRFCAGGKGNVYICISKSRQEYVFAGKYFAQVLPSFAQFFVIFN